MPEIRWYPWSKRAFQRAKKLNRPILLDISAVWCHWCHVMDQTTYSDSGVARLIEELYVPIRVDKDQRPDLDKRYNMGGWPTTAFLTSDGGVITGATYVPPDKMKSMLETVSRFYKENQESIADEIRRLKKETVQLQRLETVPSETAFESVSAREEEQQRAVI